MIKLKKSRFNPGIKNSQGNCKISAATENMKQEYSEDPQSYNSGEKTFSFHNDIYGHKSIKDELIKNQNGKCAFCEQHILSTTYGDVEHFRPKGGYLQRENSHFAKPGYYWLAYEWQNLLLSCQKCNQRYKKNLFPLLNPLSRAKNHSYNIKKEKPVFVNPYFENPKFLIGFREEVAYGKDKKGRGSRTIQALGLNRQGNGYSDLYEKRKDLYDLVQQTYLISKKDPENGYSQSEIEKARDLFKKFKSSNKEFSAMVGENFSD